ncbi:MAG: hypothetical protein Q8S73_15450 [Deltaproteobacteria bacterium]|nr:hypothetical protein [Myxococcales bacterium]MDP3215502.1 hypothetical protein [Deltaproteobacteria bacterium]
MDEPTPTEALRDGVLRVERLSYRGKHYRLPVFDAARPVLLRSRPERASLASSADSLVLRDVHSLWDPGRFLEPRRPVSLGLLGADELAVFTTPGAVRVLDLPIKMPDCDEYRLPRALAQFAGVVQRIIDVEHAINPQHADYHAYLTIDQRPVTPGTLHREAPCHVDGFQGARWHPRCRVNHSYTVSDVLPTAYYPQPFDFAGLDERVHDYFWEMNAQVADTAEAHRWQPRPAELTLMDAYCVHRGVEAEAPTERTWLRLSFEERRRVFDRLGNAHNPLFDYAWEMVERDIEQLHLVAFREGGDPSLRVFPWQDTEGRPLPPGAPKTRPRLRPR